MDTPASPLVRRSFLKASAGLAAATATPRFLSAAERARSIGANSRIRIAQIGCGSRGIGAHMAGIQKHAQATNIEVVAVSDPWRVAREKAKAKAKEAFGSDAKMCVSYREVLEIATREEWPERSPAEIAAIVEGRMRMRGRREYFNLAG